MGTFLAAAVALAGLVALPVVGWTSAAAATAVPYTDPNVAGYLGLCNQAGQQVTSGSVDATPFAWRAVSSVPAQSPYDDAGRTAVLVVYQPLQDLPPSDWSGEQLTSSSRYSNPDAPMAAATSGDDSLADVIEDFPPHWDGFYQLRIYLGTADEPAYTLKYPALNIEVTGKTWHAVGGGTVDCASGTSESIESILLPADTKTTATPAAPGQSSSHPAGASGASGASAADSSERAGSTTRTDGPPAAHAVAAADPTKSSSAGATAAVVAGILVVLAVLAAVAFLLARRRRRPTDPQPAGAARPIHERQMR